MGNTVSQGVQGDQQPQQSNKNMPPQKKQVEKFTLLDEYRGFFNNNIKEYTSRDPNLFYVNPTNDLQLSNRNNDQNFGSFKPFYGNEHPVYPNGYNGVRRINSNTESRKQLASPLSRIFDFAYTSNIPAEIKQGQDFCKNFSNLLDGGQNSNVETYSRNFYTGSENANGRCGFVYNPNFNGQPVFRGHYGEWKVDSSGKSIGVLQDIYDADILKHPDTEQYWNIDSNSTDIGARVAFNKFRCQVQAPKCSNISETGSPGCVWDNTLKRSVPINISDRGQSSWYGYRNGIDISVSDPECSPPPDVNDNRPTVTPCTTNDGVLKNGNLDRPCVSYILSNANCTDQGALLTALNAGGINTNYGIPALSGASYYPGLNTIFGNTSQTVSQTSNIIGQIASNARKPDSEYNSVNWAARDLCLSGGSLKDFDFCTEYTDSTNIYALDCLQIEFRTQGGQKTGKMYPNSNTTKPTYDAMPNWLAVKNYITAMSNRTTSADIDTQARAFNDFYGINMQQFTRQYIPRIPDIEVFWFTINSDKTISNFLGRRIQRDLTLNIANLTPTTSIQFISFFNLRPATSNTQVKFTFNNTDGIQVLKDRNIESSLSSDQGLIYAAWTDSAAKNNGVTNCWALNKNSSNPNYFTVSWYNKQSSPIFTQSLFQTCDASPKLVNAPDGPQMTMSQELDAPMLSFELIPDPTRNQIDFYSSEKKFGGNSLNSNDNISVVFGDARLRDVFPLAPTGGPTVNTTEKFGFSNRYIPGLPAGNQALTTNMSYMYGCAALNSGSYYISRANIDKGGWRTMTMLFKTGSLAEITSGSPHYIFQYNTISVGITNNGTANEFFVTVGGNTTTFNSTVVANTVYYLIIIQDPTASIGDFNTDAKLIVCVAKKSDLMSDPGKPFDEQVNGTQTLISNSEPFTGTDYKFKIGGLNTNGAPRSVEMSVGWVRFFDYVFTSKTSATVNTNSDGIVTDQNDDLTRDLNNTWKRNWWNML